MSARSITFTATSALFAIVYLSLIFGIETAAPGEFVFTLHGRWRDLFGNIWIASTALLLFGLFAVCAVRVVARRREKLLTLPTRARTATALSLACVTLGLLAASAEAIFVFLGMNHLNRRGLVLDKWVVPSFAGLLFAVLFIVAALFSAFATFKSTSSLELPRPLGPADGHMGRAASQTQPSAPSTPAAPPPTAHGRRDFIPIPGRAFDLRIGVQ